MKKTTFILILNFLNLLKILIMKEIIFIVEESKEGGYEAKALDYPIFTEGDTIEKLKKNIKEAIHCHFQDNSIKIVRLYQTKEEIFSV